MNRVELWWRAQDSSFRIWNQACLVCHFVCLFHTSKGDKPTHRKWFQALKPESVETTHTWWCTKRREFAWVDYLRHLGCTVSKCRYDRNSANTWIAKAQNIISIVFVVDYILRIYRYENSVCWIWSYSSLEVYSNEQIPVCFSKISTQFRDSSFWMAYWIGSWYCAFVA